MRFVIRYTFVIFYLSTIAQLGYSQQWRQDVGTDRGRFQYNYNGELGYSIRTSAGGGWAWQLVDGGNNSYFHVEYPTGKVGIGTTSPISLLDVKYKDANTNIYRATDASGQFRWRIDQSFDMFLSNSSGTDIVNIGQNGAWFKSGNVGIGTTTPISRLQVINGNTSFKLLQESVGVGDMMVLSSQNGSTLAVNAYQAVQQKLITEIGSNYLINSTDGVTRYAPLGTKKAPMIQLNAEDGSVSIFGENGSGYNYRNPTLNLGINVNGNGNVGIGTSSPTQKLTVNGTIYGKEVKVNLAVPGPDYVFEKDYELPSLQSIQTYIDQNKHLPEVPSAKEMQANGINLSEMNMLLLRKVEELTLYVIEMNTKFDEQQLRLEDQDKEIKKLKKK